MVSILWTFYMKYMWLTVNVSYVFLRFLLFIFILFKITLAYKMLTFQIFPFDSYKSVGYSKFRLENKSRFSYIFYTDIKLGSHTKHY